ncbi:MAG TPA: non-canonical purine NTP pyrophosphatase [Rectinemataceae bacterium]
MEILVASFNEKKVEELKPLFPQHRLYSPAELGISEFYIDENGSDYIQNALIKARAHFARTPMPILADDSGLCVRALDGAPGINSARFGSTLQGDRLTSAERNALLLKTMRGIEDRACAFVCSLVLLFEVDRFISVQETCPGYLALEPSGVGGFGYDPIVFLPELGRTVAELSSEEKAAVSHRGKASTTLNRILDSLRSVTKLV